jgi:hypothetical protein
MFALLINFHKGKPTIDVSFAFSSSSHEAALEVAVEKKFVAAGGWSFTRVDRPFPGRCRRTVPGSGSRYGIYPSPGRYPQGVEFQ